jgi:hypothetical protein
MLTSVRPPVAHEPLEEPRAPAERVAVRHEHRDEAQRPRVAQQLDHLVLGPQRDLAVGELQVARVAEHGAQEAHLLLDRLDGLGRDLVGLGVQVAAAAGEVAARHRADGRAAAVALAAEHLLRYAQLGREAFPVGREQPLGLVLHRAARHVEQPPRARASAGRAPAGRPRRAHRDAVERPFS